MALPQFGIHSPVRVCADCFNNSSRFASGYPQASPDEIESVIDEVSRLGTGVDVRPKTEAAVEHQPAVAVLECKCGMPLCICEAPTPCIDVVPPQTTTTSTSQSNIKPKRAESAVRNRGSTSKSKLSSVFNHGQVSNGTTDIPQMDYEVNGEGLREAIKNGDVAAVRKLLGEGVDANYHDKQGLSLLHLAAVFNRTEITFILMEYGASMDYKNAQGETPLDCAPATLQHKMRQKMEESRQPGVNQNA